MELNGYWLNEGEIWDLSPCAALVEIQVNHRSIQLD